jgi:hypothetical protein
MRDRGISGNDIRSPRASSLGEPNRSGATDVFPGGPGPQLHSAVNLQSGDLASDSASLIGDRLADFIRKSAGREFDWLGCNCGFWACDWIKLEAGIDPVAVYRSCYKTAGGFLRRVIREGGNEAFSRKVAKDARMIETSSPRLGDVGLIRGDGATMAIKGDRENWIVKRGGVGVLIGPFIQIVAWRLDCLR